MCDVVIIGKSPPIHSRTWYEINHSILVDREPFLVSGVSPFTRRSKCSPACCAPYSFLSVHSFAFGISGLLAVLVFAGDCCFSYFVRVLLDGQFSCHFVISCCINQRRGHSAGVINLDCPTRTTPGMMRGLLSGKACVGPVMLTGGFVYSRGCPGGIQWCRYSRRL